MKVITFVVPCYNSAAFMRRCVNSLLAADCSDIEIIIIDDGSADETSEIADDYARKFAGVVQVIHQKNAGHGGAINAGLAIAGGKYFKVIDSDDYADQAACAKLLAALRRFERENIAPDLVVSNYVYEKIGRNKHKVISYESALPEKRVIGWEQTHSFAAGKYLLMHALIYRTEILRQSRLVLPLHTFYVDNLFAYVPLTFVKTLYYMSIDLYRYSIGLAGQSVKESTMIRRIDQQIAVNRLMIESVDFNAIQNARQSAYMLHYLEIVTCVTMIILIRAKTREAAAKRGELWAYIKKFPDIYRHFRRCALLWGLCRTGAFGRFLSVVTYQAVRLVYGLN